MNNKIYIALLSLILLMLVFCGTIIFSNTIPVTNFGNINTNTNQLVIKEENSSSKALTLLESNTHRVLKVKNSNMKLPMASTTKIMTAIVSIENCDNLDEIVPIDAKSIGIEGTSIYLRKSDKLTVKELLYGLMLASGNDASMALANFFGKGEIQTFVNMMNDKAKEIGAVNTHFVNPHGLDEKEHYTTSYDLALITSYAMKNDTFREIVSTKNITINGNDEVENRFLYNKQKLLKTYPGCVGVKTGFTDNAGRCSVSAVDKDGMLVICVVLNCRDMFEESARLLDEIFEEFSMTKILPSYNIMTEVKVKDGSMDKVRVFSLKQFDYPLTESEKSFIVIKSDIPDIIDAPIEKESTIGTITVTLNNEEIFKDEIYTLDDVECKDIKSEIQQIIEQWYF